MRTLVVPDLHGRFLLGRGLLEQEGVLDPEDNFCRVRDTEVRVVQLGDLANCVPADRDGDLALLRRAGSWFDVLLVGNHEYPYLGGTSFSGFFPLMEVEQAVRNLSWRAAYAVGETLVTHAGVSAGFLPDLPACEIADLLNSAWLTKPRHPWFSQCGVGRGGSALHGSVLWRDDSESLDVGLSQVYGHTVDTSGPIHRTHGESFSLNLDCGGHGPHADRIAAAWLSDDGTLDRIVEYLL